MPTEAGERTLADLARREAERCPGGYLVKGNGLCGATGNRCQDRCAFAYRGRPAALLKALEGNADG